MALAIPALARRLVLLDCIVDGGIGPGPMTRRPERPGRRFMPDHYRARGAALLRGSTRASSSIFERTDCSHVQSGCVRFSYVTPNSRVPRRYRCQPDLSEAREIALREELGPLSPAERTALRERVRLRVRPEYTSEPYGQPAFLQLALDGPPEIATGAEEAPRWAPIATSSSRSGSAICAPG